jgi:uncharacterized protein YaaW (UPF0174 family)
MTGNECEDDSLYAKAIYEEVLQKFGTCDRISFMQKLGALYKDSPENLIHVRQCLY